MKATALEYRFRYALHFVLYVLGFTAPWNAALHLDPAGPISHVWGLLAIDLTQLGVSTVVNPFDLLLMLAILFAVTGAGLRTWGGAYLGASVVQSQAMHTANGGILTDGPFGYTRNPLYLGTFLHTIALVLLMPRSGAIFALVAIGLLQARLILAEEPFLSARLGTPYAAYCSLVPRIVPSLRRKVEAQGLKPRWMQAFLGEIYFWGVALAFAALGWRYNTLLVIQGVVVAVGLSILTKALMPSLDRNR